MGHDLLLLAIGGATVGVACVVALAVWASRADWWL